MDLEWDPHKAAANLRKHGLSFMDASAVLYDELAITALEDASHEDRFVTIGMDAFGRVVVLVYTWRQGRIRLISARRASRSERARYAVRGGPMKRNYTFKDGKRGAVIPSAGKTRITIRLDDESLRWFREKANELGGGSYQTSINDALREYIATQEGQLEDTFRRVLREELPRYTVRKRSPK